MNGHAVIGANFGDEAKGKQVDYLCSKLKKTIVVRYNGGCQAGHTVNTPEGVSHVFKHFGSWTLLNVPTYLAVNFIVNPIAFRVEYDELLNKGAYPYVYVSEGCYVSTPFDMLINQLVELSRGLGRHGSCGWGINETVERNHNSFNQFGLNVARLRSTKSIKEFLDNIKNQYTKSRLWELGISKKDIKDNYLEILEDDKIIKKYIEDCEFFLSNVRIIDLKIPEQYENAIFEGAQGLLLDKNNKEYFPHVTRSKTGLYNILTQCKFNKIENLKVNYMTRAYLTRHGAGFLPNEKLNEKPYVDIHDTTNIFNIWQENLRYAYLDINLLKKSIHDDLSLNDINSNIKIDPSLSITCMDEVGERFKFFENGTEKYITTFNRKWFADIISNKIEIPVTELSYGKTRNNIMKV